MKKAQMNWQLVGIVLACIVFVTAAFAFIPQALDKSKDFFGLKIFDTAETEVIDEAIDEERIPAGKKILVDSVDWSSGYTIIVKQEYGKGWNLEHFLKRSEEENCKWLWWSPPERCIPLGTLIANKPLREVLLSPKLYGKIEINGITYAHIPNTKEHDPAIPDYYWRMVTAEDDTTITYGEEISAEDITKIILAHLYEEETS